MNEDNIIKDLFNLYNTRESLGVDKSKDVESQIIYKIEKNRQEIYKILNERVDNTTGVVLDDNNFFKYKNIQVERYNNFYKLIEQLNKVFNSAEYNKITTDTIDNIISSFNKNIENQFTITNNEISLKINSILDKKRIKNVKIPFMKTKEIDIKITKIDQIQVLNANKDEFNDIINDFINNIYIIIQGEYSKYIIERDKFINFAMTNQIVTNTSRNDTHNFMNYFNNLSNDFLKKIKNNLKHYLALENNDFIKKLFDILKKSFDDFKFPKKEVGYEDLNIKYESFKKNVYEKENFNNINILLIYEELFNTNTGDWILDSKKEGIIKNYKDKYDELLIKLKPEKFELSNDNFPELNEYNDKIKEIKLKLEKKEKLQEKEVSLIYYFDKHIEEIKNNPKYIDNPKIDEYIEKLKKLVDSIKINDKNIKEKVEEELKNKRVIDDIITDEERDNNKETIYFSKNVNIFKLVLKLFTYGAIFLLFIVLFISILGILILIYDIIINTIKLFVNSANSTNNLSLDYISKSIIRCNKDNYSKDRYLILTEQKQNVTIFNIGAYTLYLLIIYFFLYLFLVFYASQMRFKFVGSIYDIDKNFIYLQMIGILIIYSIIHLLIFKTFFKPFVYIPYKTIDDEETAIDKMISSYINVLTDEKKIIVLNDYFELLYDSSRISELNEHLLSQIKNEDKDGCLEQKIIIYNLYEYLRQYVYFDEDFKYNFKQYCSTNELNKPRYDNGNTITFISLLKNDEVLIISNYHEDLDFINNLEDNNIEFYNKINTLVSNKIKEINKKIITHNKTILPFFITIVYIFLIFIFNLLIFYIITKMIKDDKTDSYHINFVNASKFVHTYIFEIIIKLFNSKK
jgi:hypothetical protein